MANPKELNEIPVILLNGKLTSDNSYRLDVSGFPTREHARQFAALIAGYGAQALNEIMGAPPNQVVADGPGATAETVADIEMKSGQKVTMLKDVDIAATITASMREAMAQMVEELEKDDCQCPGCVARREYEAKIKAGSKSDAKH